MKYLKTFESHTNTIPLNEITKEEFKELLHSNCSQFLEVIRKLKEGKEVNLNRGNFIFRKFSEDIGNLVFTNPKDSPIERIAPWSDWGNWHNIIISNLESWSEYPRRNKSLIGSSGMRAFTHTGNTTYLIIPYDTTKIGVCNKEDFWDSFKTYSSQGIWVAKWVSLLVSSINKINNIKLNDRDYSTILPYLDKKYNTKEVKNFKDLFKIGSDILYDNEKTLLENLNKFLCPEFNSFKLDTFSGVSKLISKGSYSKECWFEDESLLINLDYLTKMDSEDFKDIFLS